jgi:hypothetical protein
MACCRALPSLSTNLLDAILRSIHRARLALRRAPPLFEAAHELSFAEFTLVTADAVRLTTTNRQAPLSSLPARPTKRGGARRKASLAGRGYAPHKPTGSWGSLFRLGPKFDLWLPPSELPLAGARGKFGSCGKLSCMKSDRRKYVTSNIMPKSKDFLDWIET